jgi:1-acyl-sn-glycerol-3-phosphate acyltransferase
MERAFGMQAGSLKSDASVNHLLRTLFFLLVVRPVTLIVLGMNVRRYERLARRGPAVIAANHNSHLDALALMTLYGTRELRDVRPVAAADYFLRNRFLKWFATRIIGIIPLQRRVRGARTDPLAPIVEALEQNRIVILFPEGSRGDPEKLDEFKTGIAHLAKRRPDVDVLPVFMHGFGKALPRGEALLVPFFCDVYVGEALRWTGDRGAFMAELTGRMRTLADEAGRPEW